MNNDDLIEIDGVLYFFNKKTNELCEINLDIEDNILHQAQLNSNNHNKQNDQFNQTEINEWCMANNHNEQNNQFNQTNQTNQTNKNEMNEWYMENYDIDFWEDSLSRPLDGDEKKIFHGV